MDHVLSNNNVGPILSLQPGSNRMRNFELAISDFSSLNTNQANEENEKQMVKYEADIR